MTLPKEVSEALAEYREVLTRERDELLLVSARLVLESAILSALSAARREGIDGAVRYGDWSHRCPECGAGVCSHAVLAARTAREEALRGAVLREAVLRRKHCPECTRPFPGAFLPGTVGADQEGHESWCRIGAALASRVSCPATATGNPVDCGGCPEHVAPEPAPESEEDR